MPEKKKSPVLATFRRDLSIYPGPAESDGTPTYVVLDPIKGQYYKITWAHALVMRVLTPGMTLDELVKQVNARSSLRVSEEEIIEILNEAARLDLLAIPKSSEEVQLAADRAHTSWLWWLLMHYLYIRIPIVNPDKFLQDTIDYVKPLISKPALVLYSLIIISGLFTVLLNIEQYLHTFTYFFNFEGFLGYSLTIISVKILHELGHAYTAKYFKIHVPTMGIAFLVLWPVLYTNVTNSWKLQNRTERLAITASGIIVELVLAGLATLGWAITDPGIMHSAFFIISSTTWVTSLLMNCNPAMRFDGYYLFTDIVGIDNLQSRSFAMTRWKLREWFLGLNMPPPEKDITPKQMKIMLVYSIYTWIYRIVLYTTIAIFVYYKFTKILGIFLFLVEVAVFIVAPFASEFVTLTKLREHIHVNTRLLITTLIGSLAFVWFVFPLPHYEYFSAVTHPYNEQDIYVPESAMIANVYVHRGEYIPKEKTLLQLQSNKLQMDYDTVKSEADLLEEEIYVLGLHEMDRHLLKTKEAELKHKLAELSILNEKRQKLTIKSDHDGELYEWNDSIRPGLYVAEGNLLGKIGQPNQLKIIAFVPEDEISGIEIGNPATFKLLNPIVRFTGKVSGIYDSPSPYLNYPPLASTYKGNLAVEPVKEQVPSKHADNRLKLLQRYYEVEIILDPIDYPLRFGQTGIVEYQGPWESKLWNLLRKTKNVIWKESGF